MLDTNPTQAASRRDRFLRLFAPCEHGLLGHARRLLRGDEDRAQDLAQEALVRAYDAFRKEQFRDGHQPCAWLRRIATNHFINEFRRSRKWDAGVTVEALTAGGDIGPEATRSHRDDRPDTSLDARTLDEPLERALAALPDALRITIQLVDLEDRSYAEAAELLGVPIGTVRSRLARARYTLQAALAGYARERGYL